MALLNYMVSGSHWICEVDATPAFAAPVGSIAMLNTAPGTLWRATDAAGTWTEVGAGGSSGAWDWAAEASEGLLPDVDQLQGDVDLALWNDASTYGADRSLTSFTKPTSTGGKMLVAELSPHASDAGGFLMPTVAGDFVYAARFGVALYRDEYTSGTLNISLSGGAGVHFCYVDHASSVDTGVWIGGGLYWPASSWANVVMGTYKGNSAGNHWDSLAASATYGRTSGTNGSAPNDIDVWIKRTGTTLSIYGCAARGVPTVWEGFPSAVISTAGLIGFRMAQQTTTAGYPNIRCFLKAFARMTAVPGN